MCHLLNLKKIMISHVTNKVNINLKWGKCDNLCKPLIKKYISNLISFSNYLLTIKVKSQGKKWDQNKGEKDELGMKLKYERQFHDKIFS